MKRLNREKIFDSSARLRILTYLALKGRANFSEIKNALNLTDGNLSTHLQKLEKAGIIKSEKRFVGRRPQTTYWFTEEGRVRFESYLSELESMIKKLKEKR